VGALPRSSVYSTASGGGLYGLDHRIFFERVEQVLKEERTGDVRVLDYGCGLGDLGILVAQRGFQVDGFDISPEAVQGAKRWASNSGVDDRVDFRVANAQQLPYDDGTFDLVFGKAVLHHTIKYIGTGDELWRVMKPGARAFFMEGAATNPLIRFARVFTIREELGDVPLTTRNIAEWGSRFTDINIDGYFFLYMLKRLGFESYDDELEGRGKNVFGKTKLYRGLLRLFLVFDEWMVNEKSYSDLVAGRYIIEVTK
jgi:ubiquinone/menaquinone biosynthesis C-methylase UbiE